MNYAAKTHPATESQIQCILRITGCDDFAMLPHIPDAPLVCATLSEQERMEGVDARKAARIIETLRTWSITHEPATSAT